MPRIPIQIVESHDPIRQRTTERPLIILADPLGGYLFDIEFQTRKADVISSLPMMEFQPVAVVYGCKSIRVDDFGCADILRNGQSFNARAVLSGKSDLRVESLE